MSEPFDLQAWLRARCDEYSFDVGGIFHRRGEHPWPIRAIDAGDLEAQLAEGGHLLPLPKEPAALANVLEVSIVDFLIKRAAATPGLEVRRGTERGYPDVELSGVPLSGAFHAVDVKVARRASTASQARTQSRITLYTGNTYFKWPKLHWPGTFRAFDDYASHLDVLVIYTLSQTKSSRAESLELLVQEPWRIACKKRSSTTREYIGAVDLIDDLRTGTGEFSSPDEFYKFWRAYPFKVSPQVQRQLQRLLDLQEKELASLRGDAARRVSGS